MDGPAYRAAASPASTKIPVQMMAPSPSKTKSITQIFFLSFVFDGFLLSFQHRRGWHNGDGGAQRAGSDVGGAVSV